MNHHFSSQLASMLDDRLYIRKVLQDVVIVIVLCHDGVVDPEVRVLNVEVPVVDAPAGTVDDTGDAQPLQVGHVARVAHAAQVEVVGELSRSVLRQPHGLLGEQLLKAAQVTRVLGDGHHLLN